MLKWTAQSPVTSINTGAFLSWLRFAALRLGVLEIFERHGMESEDGKDFLSLVVAAWLNV